MAVSLVKDPPGTNVGGYDVSLVSQADEASICCLCHRLMKDAIQTIRGERACASCYFEIKGESTECPIDGAPITNAEVFPDNWLRNHIKKLKCYCSYRSAGCGWDGSISDVEAHQELHCAYGPHKKEQQLPCPYLCGMKTSLRGINKHVLTCENVAYGTRCPYEILGCKYQPASHVDLTNHLRKDAMSHATTTVCNMTNVRAEHERIKADLLTEQVTRTEMLKQLDNKDTKSMTHKLTKLQETLTEMIHGHADLKGNFGYNIEKLENGIALINDRLQESELLKFDFMLRDLTKKYNDIESRLTNVQQGSTQNSLPGLQPQHASMLSSIDCLENGSAITGVNISDLELKLQLLENTTYVGKQLWKIDNITYRMFQATTGKVTALHSAPCFQKRGGYKFCSRLYLNGDGIGKNTHISLFFVLMKSEYDALLKWPFGERVTFRLINPYQFKADVTERFTPDPTSSSFRQPEKSMNVAAGCVQLLPKEKLESFIINDSIFIVTSIVD